MNIIINGTSQQLTSAKNLSDIVSTFCKQSKHVITELNGTIVPSDQWAQTNLQRRRCIGTSHLRRRWLK